MTDDLTPVLSQLPEPMPPSTLTATVMARIEREVALKADSTIAVPVNRGRELQTWLWTIAGIAVVVMVSLSVWLSSDELGRRTAQRIGIDPAALIPIQTSVSVFLALGLVAYLAGLFAPLRRDV